MGCRLVKIIRKTKATRDLSLQDTQKKRGYLDMCFKEIFTKLAVLGVMVALSVLQGCDSGRSAELPRQECINTAKTEMIRRGIDYDQFLQREWEFSKYIWINDKLFVADETVPLRFATKVRLHNSYTHGIIGEQNSMHPFPGVDAVQRISLDKFKEANPEIIKSQLDRSVPFMRINLYCSSLPAEPSNEIKTLDDVVINTLHKKPSDLYIGFHEGLGAYYFHSDTMSPYVYYVLFSDGKVDSRYPILMCEKGDENGICFEAFMYKKGVRFSYTFPKAQLSDWVRLHDFVMRAIDQSYRQGSNK